MKQRVDFRIEKDYLDIIKLYSNDKMTNLIMKSITEYLINNYEIEEEHKTILKYITSKYV